MSFLYFLLLLGALVVIHELGHFTAAKLLDFKVVSFTIGFGRRLVRIRSRETVYQIGLIPLGGFVQILGEESDAPVGSADAHRAFSAKPLWQRAIVVLSGPAASLLFPVLIYFVFFVAHSQLPAAVIGDVISSAPAARAGIDPGDRILSVNGDKVRYWAEVDRLVDASINRDLHLRIKRGTRTIEKYLVPVERTVRARDGRSSREGWIGISQAPFRPQIGVIDPGSPAGRAGLQTGDVVISVDGETVENWTALERTLRANPGRRTIAYLRGSTPLGLPSVRTLAAGVADLVPETRISRAGERTIITGLARAEMFVAEVEPGSPAHRSGLRPGDLVTHLDDKPQSHWLLFDQSLQSDPDRSWQIRWLRTQSEGGATPMAAPLRQELIRSKNELGQATERLSFGATNRLDAAQGELVDIDGRLTYATSRAVERTLDTIVAMVRGFGSILRGATPHEQLGGPLTMYRAASVSGSKGWDAFLLMLALISVNLGLLNLLPVPMLDGGHLLVLMVERVRHEPLSSLARRRIMRAGLALVVAITLLALHNDILRYLP